jgi:hypothetical protein
MPIASALLLLAVAASGTGADVRWWAVPSRPDRHGVARDGPAMAIALPIGRGR